jgi:uncharacterized protein YqgC (DUF456 family)
MHVVGLFVLFLACLLALLSLPFGAPGTLLIVVAALVYAWATDFAVVGWSTLGWLTLLAVIAEVAEFLSSAAGASGSRPSPRVAGAALLGAFVGGILGMPILFGLGALLGALAGAFVGAALAAGYESKEVGTALASGWAALRGRFVGFVVKAGIAVAMIGVLGYAALR